MLEHGLASADGQDERILPVDLRLRDGAHCRLPETGQRLEALAVHFGEHAGDEFELARRGLESLVDALPLGGLLEIGDEHTGRVLLELRNGQGAGLEHPIQARVEPRLEQVIAQTQLVAQLRDDIDIGAGLPHQLDRRLREHHIAHGPASRFAALHRGACRQDDIGVLGTVGQEGICHRYEVEFAEGVDEALRIRKHPMVEAHAKRGLERVWVLGQDLPWDIAHLRLRGQPVPHRKTTGADPFRQILQTGRQSELAFARGKASWHVHQRGPVHEVPAVDVEIACQSDEAEHRTVVLHAIRVMDHRCRTGHDARGLRCRVHPGRLADQVRVNARDILRPFRSHLGGELGILLETDRPIGNEISIVEILVDDDVGHRKRQRTISTRAQLQVDVGASREGGDPRIDHYQLRPLVQTIEQPLAYECL